MLAMRDMFLQTFIGLPECMYRKTRSFTLCAACVYSSRKRTLYEYRLSTRLAAHAFSKKPWAI